MKTLIIRNEDHFHFRSDQEAVAWATNVSQEPCSISYKARVLPDGGTELAVMDLVFKDGLTISIVF